MDYIDEIQWVGNRGLLALRKTAFLSSEQTPMSLFPYIQRWAMRMPVEECVICGNESEIEQTIFSVLFMRRVNLIMLTAAVPSEALIRRYRRAIDEGRLLIGWHCADTYTVERRSALDRNEVMMCLADHIVVGYCTIGGAIDRARLKHPDMQFITYPNELFKD